MNTGFLEVLKGCWGYEEARAMGKRCQCLGDCGYVLCCRNHGNRKQLTKKAGNGVRTKCDPCLGKSGAQSWLVLVVVLVLVLVLALVLVLVLALAPTRSY